MATERAPAAELPRTPEAIERDWYENVYAGDDTPQLTMRALIMGMVLGGFLSISNVYIGLKAGWSLGVSITSCILAYSIFAMFHRLFPKWFPAFGGCIITWMRDAEASWLKVSDLSWMPKWSPFTQLVAPTWAPWLKYPRIRATWGTEWISIGGRSLNQYTMSLEGSLLFVATGA